MPMLSLLGENHCQSWFGLDFDWIEVNYTTREPDLYKETLSEL